MSDLERDLDAIGDNVPPPAGLRRAHEIGRAIDAGLAAPARERRVWWPRAVLGATVVAAAAIAIWLLARPPAPPEPTIIVEYGAVAPPVAGQPVEVAAHDRVGLRMPDDSEIDASELTRFVRIDRAATRWRLDRGHLRAHVTKRAPGQAFEVVTPEATVTVVGTRFSVDRSVVDGVATTSVEVEEGVVRVTPAGGESVTLHAGETWPSARAAANPTEPPPPSDAAVPSHAATPPDAATPTHPVRPARAVDAKAIRKIIRAGKLADARKLIDDGLKAATAPRDLAELGILAAEAALAERSTRQAITLYLAVVRDYPTTPQAEQALFAAAQLAFDRPDAGYRPEALLRDYLDTYPQGEFTSDAQRLLDNAEK